MPAPADAQAELERLRAELHALRQENELLTDKAEDVLLLGVVTERIALEHGAEGVIALTLESVASMKEIAYAAHVTRAGDLVEVADDFGPGLAWSARGRRFPAPEGLGARLEGGWLGQLPQQAAALPFLPGRIGDRPANAFYWAPIPAGRRPDGRAAEPRGDLLLVNTFADSGYLEGLVPLIDRIRDVVGARLEILSLVEEIQTINRGLEETVARRTEELRQSERRHRAVLESAWDAIITISVDGQILSWNSGARRTLGYDHEEVLGQSVSLLAPADAGAEDQTGLLAAVRRDGPLLGKETVRLAKDGSRVPVEMNLSALRDERGELVGYCGVIRDISERKRATAVQQELQKQLVQSQRMEGVGKLAGGIAHDFNNLLTGIRGFVEIAIDELPSAAPARADLQEAMAASDRAVELTRQLLLFSRRTPADLRPVALNRSVDELRRMLGRIIGERYTLTTALAEDLGPILADQGHLDQVLMNLVINARDAMPDGGEITISTRNRAFAERPPGSEARPGRFVELAVADTGTGIEADDLSQIFEPFFTTKSGSGELGGSGLGLSVVYGIVAQHGGWIDVNSTPGEGTLFRVYLPIVEAEAPESIDELAPRARDGGRGERILVVEDDAVVRNLFVQSLRRLGYEVAAAETAETALAEFDRVDFQLVISDIGLPGIDGVALAERLQRQRPGLKVLLATGYSSETNWQAMHKQGWPVMKKPFHMLELSQRVRELLDDR